jgi:hypothetical protein
MIRRSGTRRTGFARHIFVRDHSGWSRRSTEATTSDLSRPARLSTRFASVLSTDSDLVTAETRLVADYPLSPRTMTAGSRQLEALLAAITTLGDPGHAMPQPARSGSIPKRPRTFESRETAPWRVSNPKTAGALATRGTPPAVSAMTGRSQPARSIRAILLPTPVPDESPPKTVLLPGRAPVPFFILEVPGRRFHEPLLADDSVVLLSTGTQEVLAKASGAKHLKCSTVSRVLRGPPRHRLRSVAALRRSACPATRMGRCCGSTSN